jgi:hypothetical protein
VIRTKSSITPIGNGFGQARAGGRSGATVCGVPDSAVALRAIVLVCDLFIRAGFGVVADVPAGRRSPVGVLDVDEITRELIRPVFSDGGARRQRLMARVGGAVSALVLAYLLMLGVTITASPNSGRPVEGASAVMQGPTPPAAPSRAPAAQAHVRDPVRPGAVPDDDRDEPVRALHAQAPTTPPAAALPTTPPAQRQATHRKPGSAAPAPTTSKAPVDKTTTPRPSAPA